MYIVGPEFQELEGHILVIHTALYSLKSSGLRWHKEYMISCWTEILYPAKLIFVSGSRNPKMGQSMNMSPSMLKIFTLLVKTLLDSSTL